MIEIREVFFSLLFFNSHIVTSGLFTNFLRRTETEQSAAQRPLLPLASRATALPCNDKRELLLGNVCKKFAWALTKLHSDLLFLMAAAR